MGIFVIATIRLMAEDMNAAREAEETQQYDLMESGYMNGDDGVPELNLMDSQSDVQKSTHTERKGSINNPNVLTDEEEHMIT